MYGSQLGEQKRALESSKTFYKNNYSEQKLSLMQVNVLLAW